MSLLYILSFLHFFYRTNLFLNYYKQFKQQNKSNQQIIGNNKCSCINSLLFRQEYFKFIIRHTLTQSISYCFRIKNLLSRRSSFEFSSLLLFSPLSLLLRAYSKAQPSYCHAFQAFNLRIKNRPSFIPPPYSPPSCLSSQPAN